MDRSPPSIFWSEHKITREMRAHANRHRSFVIWLTGLSAAGKSSIAMALEAQLFAAHIQSYVLDGDNLRHGLNQNLGFHVEDRKENIRRVGEVAKLMVDAGIITIVALISPFRADRARVRNMFADDEFVEVFVDCPLDICAVRDPKGLYQKALNGEIANFTGVSSPYEAPNAPELTVATHQLTVEQAVKNIIDYVKSTGKL